MGTTTSKNKSTKSNNTKNAGTHFYKHWFTKQLLMAAGAVLVTLFILFSLLKLVTRHNQELEVPSFLNMTLEQAEEVADRSHLRLEVTDSVYINKMAPGAIFRQNPEAASKVKKNRRIILTVNAKSPKMVQMPSLVGFSLRQAQSELIAGQLSIGRLIYVSDIATNNVLEQLYNGRSIAPGTKIPGESIIDLKLGMNKNDSTTYVPELKAVPYILVREALADHSLNLARTIFDNTVHNYADSLEAVVYKQSPVSSNTEPVAMGTAVTVYLTKNKSLLENTPAQ